MFFDKKLPKSSKLYCLELGLHPSVTYIVEAMNTLIQGRHNHSESCITVEMSRRSQKVEIYLAKEGSGLAIFSTELRHSLKIIVGKEFGVMLRGKGPHKLKFADNLVHIHSLMTYTDLTEYNIVGDTKALLMRCFPFFNLKAGDIITTGQHMNYQTFSNLHFRPLLKKSFHSFQIDMRHTSDKKIPSVFVRITRLVLIFRKASNKHLQPKRRYKVVASRQVEIQF